MTLSGYHKELAESKGVQKIHVTLSHSKDSAMAYVVLED